MSKEFQETVAQKHKMSELHRQVDHLRELKEFISIKGCFLFIYLFIYFNVFDTSAKEIGYSVLSSSRNFIDLQWRRWY